MTTALTLLRDLRQKGAIVRLSGDRLVVDAPAGLVSTETRDALRSAKPDLARFLEVETRLLGMSLDEFRGWDHAVEMMVPWFPETLWFVPRVQHVRTLVTKGIPRGRIWTAGELADVLSIPAITRDDIQSIGHLKAAFGAEIASVERDPICVADDADTGAPACCLACGQRRYWRSVHGALTCGVCHPPADAELVHEWIVADGPSQGSDV